MKRTPKHGSGLEKASKSPSVQDDNKGDSRALFGNWVSMVSTFTGVTLNDSVSSPNVKEKIPNVKVKENHCNGNVKSAEEADLDASQKTPSSQPRRKKQKKLKSAAWNVIELPSVPSIDVPASQSASPKKSKNSNETSTPAISHENGTPRPKKKVITSTPSNPKQTLKESFKTPNPVTPSQQTPPPKTADMTPSVGKHIKTTPVSAKAVFEALRAQNTVSARAVYAVINPQTPASSKSVKHKKRHASTNSQDDVSESSASPLNSPASNKRSPATPQSKTIQIKSAKRKKIQIATNGQDDVNESSVPEFNSPALNKSSPATPQSKTPAFGRATASLATSTPNIPQEDGICRPKKKGKSDKSTVSSPAIPARTPNASIQTPDPKLGSSERIALSKSANLPITTATTPLSIRKALKTTPESAKVVYEALRAQKPVSARAVYALIKPPTPTSSSKSVKRKKESTPDEKEKKEDSNFRQILSPVSNAAASNQQPNSSKKKKQRTKSEGNIIQVSHSSLLETPKASFDARSSANTDKRKEPLLSQFQQQSQTTSNDLKVVSGMSNSRISQRRPIIFQPTTNFIASPQLDRKPASVRERKVENVRLNASIVENVTLNESVVEEAEGELVSDLDYVILTENSVLLLLPANSYLPFKGRFDLTVIAGSIKVLGCRMEADLSKSYSLYSSRGYSLIPLQALQSGSPSHVDAFFAQRPQYGQHCTYCKNKVSQEGQTLLLLERFDNPLTEYLRVCHETNLLQKDPIQAPDMSPEAVQRYKKICNVLDTSFLVAGIAWKASTSRVIKTPSEWENLVAPGSVAHDAVITLCGGKGVGKSTLLRYLANRLLEQFPALLVLDLDPGQAEFTPPGSISAVVVTEPLLGPNFTHLRTPQLSYFVGDINIANCPDRYSNAVKQLIEECRSRGFKMPCLVNTMGFSSGLGFDLTLDVLRLVQPTLVVELRSRSASRNFPIELKADNVWRCPDGWSTRHHVHAIPLTYNYSSLRSVAESHAHNGTNEWGMRPAELRSIVILAYWSRLALCPLPDNWTLCSVTPYSVPWRSLYLSVCHEVITPGLVLAAMLGNQVALCHVDQASLAQVPCFASETEDTTPHVLTQWPSNSPCLGYGLVRAVDMEKQMVFVLTPEPIERLEQVNALAMGNVFLPQVMYAKAPKGVRIPYMEVGLPATGPALYQPGRKKNLPRQQGGLSA